MKVWWCPEKYAAYILGKNKIIYLHERNRKTPVYL
jgi:hypothetical protein